MQDALAARWLAAWSRRRVLTAWRQTARRSASLKAAFLTGRSSSSQQEQPLPTPLQALAATAAAFQPVKAFVAEAAQQLGQLQQGLRSWDPFLDGDAAEAPETFQAQRRAEPLPFGSVELLLAAVAPEPKQPQLQHQGTALHMAEMQQAQPGPAAAAATSGWAQQPPVIPCSPAADAASELEVVPAPDPGSPPPAYNPASYASPARQQYQQRRRAGHAAATVAAEAPAAVEAELLECQEHVGRLHVELGALEQASHAFIACPRLLARAGPSAQHAGSSRYQ